MMDRFVIRWGILLYNWQLVFGALTLVGTYLFFYHSLAMTIPPDGLSQELLGDWWRHEQGGLWRLVPLLAIVIVVYMIGYWYWLMRYLQALAGSTRSKAFPWIALIGILQLLVSAILIVVPILLALVIHGDPTQTFSERPFVISVGVALFVGVTLVVTIGVPLVRAKLLLASSAIALPSSIRHGFSYSWQRKGWQLYVMVFAIVVTAVLWWLGTLLPSLSAPVLWRSIAVVIAYQALSLSRCVLRAWVVERLAQ